MLIAQLSDPHLRPQGQLYQGLVDSNGMFEAAIRHLNSLDPAPDLVLLSGDLTEQGTQAEYQFAHTVLSSIRQPLIVIPGNHDDREGFRSCFSDHAHIPRTGPLHFAVGHYGALRIVALDVTVPGKHHGDLDDDACRWLDQTLAAEPQRPTMLMMHHHPFQSGIAYMDKYNCRGFERLESIIQQYDNVERIVCGHIHRFMQLRFGGTMLVTAPSTTTAIALRLDPSASGASFVEPPAMLLHHWEAGRPLITHLVPIGSFAGPMPFF
jgi:3',5'-cyclic-AMP phosphodiesterase